jgi:beta-lactamase class A
MSSQKSKKEVPESFYKKIVSWHGLFFVFIVALALGLGLWIGSIRTLDWTKKILSTIHPIREHNSNYSFIYPLLLYDFGDVKQFFEDHVLEAKINQYVQSQYQQQNAKSISVYFRDFGTTGWAGINQNIQYQPGSMMKVIIMMGYFREAELAPEILGNKFTYTNTVEQQVDSLAFHLPTALVVGQSYTVDDLIKKMIADSDNGAENLLLDNINSTILNQVYVDLGISSPDLIPNYIISPADYSDFLKILYNSTYLNEMYSEKALSIMSQSTYVNGIVAGLPKGVTVAHKYGERLDISNNSVQDVELHDCGIVYAANHPYILCVMTKGSDVSKLALTIKSISNLIYSYVETH